MHPRLRASALFLCALALSACGSGGTGPFIGVTPTPGPASASSSASIGASGGTLTATVGSKVVTVTVPAGAVSANATFTLTGYGANASVHPFAKRAQASRSQQASTLGTFLAGFTIDDGGVPLYRTLTISISGTGAAQGTIARLAMYGTKSASYTDVDTATVSSGTATNDDNKAFVGISSASSSNPYAFYTTATATPSPAPITLAATSTTTQPFPILGSAVLSGSGSDANGNPLAFVPSLSLDSTTVGTLATTSTPPYTATLTTGNVSATANVVVSDAVRSLTGKTKGNVGSQRPTSGGDTYSYAGTWSQTFVRTGQPTMTTTATLADAVTVTSGASFNSVSGLYDFKSVDTATSNLATTALTSHEYDGINLAGSPITYSDYGLKTDDGFGSTTTLTYLTPQLIDQLPETNGVTWSNTGASTLVENDASSETSTLTYSANGTYSQTTLYPLTSGTPALQNLITENSDGSGSSNFTVGGGPAFSFAIAAPSAGSITITPSFMPPATVTSWFTTPPSLFSETDALGSSSLPSGCTTGTGIPTTVNKLERVINRLDTIIGFTEQQTIDSYVTGGYGVVCVTINDVLSNYYNMQGDVPTSFAWFSQPYLVTTTTQTLALQSGTVVGAQSRSAQGLPLIAQGLFQARLMQTQRLQRKALIHNLVHVLSKGAVR